MIDVTEEISAVRREVGRRVLEAGRARVVTVSCSYPAERDVILRQFPGTFTVPARYAKHMMVVADIAKGDAGAIEDALGTAWQLQRDAG